MSWQSAYWCCLPKGTAEPVLPSRVGWGLFVLFGLQCALLGASDEIDWGKYLFAFIYGTFLMGGVRLLARHGVASHEPLVRWTLALMGLCCASRVVGAFVGISTLDWIRDFFPLLNFSWILIGPLVFSGRHSVWRAYTVFMVINVLITVVVTDHYLMLRRWSDEALEWSEFFRATDAVVLFGVFAAVPMTGLPCTRYRTVFGLLTATFIAAALFTGTRSHIGAILAGLLFYFWLTKAKMGTAVGVGRRAVLAWVLLGLSGFAAVISTGFLNRNEVLSRVEETGTTDFGALTRRLQESLIAWDDFRQRPLFGQGLGYQIPTVLLTDGQWHEDQLYFIHNFYLFILVKFGVVGIPVFLGFLVSMLRSAISTFRQAELPFDLAFSSGLASLLVALLVESLTSPRFQDRTATALLSILTVFLLAMRREIALNRKRAAATTLLVCRPSPANTVPLSPTSAGSGS